MPKEQQQKKQATRYVFSMDANLTKAGFTSYEEAKVEADKLVDSEEQRVRIRWRIRTSKWDVVVKRRVEVGV